MASLMSSSLSLWRSCLIHFCAEVGERSFLVVILLAAWCPIQGIRFHGDHFALHEVLIVLGAFSALLLRTLVLPATTLGGDDWLDAASVCFEPIVLAGLALKAFLDLWQADDHKPLAAPKRDADEDWRLAASGTAADPGIGGVKMWDPSQEERAEEGGAKPVLASYGAAPLPPAKLEDNQSALLALLLPLLLVAFMRPQRNDVITTALTANAAWNSWLWGAMIGVAAAVAVAVLVGIVLERETSDTRLLLVVAVSFTAMSFAGLSQAVVHFVLPDSGPVLPPPGTETGSV